MFAFVCAAISVKTKIQGRVQMSIIIISNVSKRRPCQPHHVFRSTQTNENEKITCEYNNKTALKQVFICRYTTAPAVARARFFYAIQWKVQSQSASAASFQSHWRFAAVCTENIPTDKLHRCMHTIKSEGLKQ